MSETSIMGVTVVCSQLACERQITVPVERVVDVAIAAGLAVVTAEVLPVPGCERSTCGEGFGYGRTNDTSHIDWLMGNVDESKTHDMDDGGNVVPLRRNR